MEEKQRGSKVAIIAFRIKVSVTGLVGFDSPINDKASRGEFGIGLKINQIFVVITGDCICEKTKRFELNKNLQIINKNISQ